jgi:hypothetical protein
MDKGNMDNGNMDNGNMDNEERGGKLTKKKLKIPLSNGDRTFGLKPNETPKKIEIKSPRACNFREM